MCISGIFYNNSECIGKREWIYSILKMAHRNFPSQFFPIISIPYNPVGQQKWYISDKMKSIQPASEITITNNTDKARKEREKQKICIWIIFIVMHNFQLFFWDFFVVVISSQAGRIKIPTDVYDIW